MNNEVRTFTTEFEVRKDEETGSNKIIGYAAKFNQESKELGHYYRFIEKIEPGAFDNVLSDDVRALFNHDPNVVLGRTKSGTLKISKDEFGLRYEVTPPDTQVAKDLIVSMQRGDVTQSSFKFTIEDDDIEYDEEREIYVRTIKKFKRLYDVCPVTFPAYEGTESVVSKRLESLENKKSDEEEKIEKIDKLRKKLSILG